MTRSRGILILVRDPGPGLDHPRPPEPRPRPQSLLRSRPRHLPLRKLARYLQIENKLDAIVRADLTRQIPLVP